MRQAPHNTTVESQHTVLNMQTVPNTYFLPVPLVAMDTQTPQGSCVSMLTYDLGVKIGLKQYHKKQRLDGGYQYGEVIARLL